MRVMRKTLIEVGLFVGVGLAVALVSVFFIGRERSLFEKTYTLIAPFEDVSGLRQGAVVQLAGLNVGYVAGVSLPKDKTTHLEVVLKVSKNYKNYIRRDSQATLETQGLLGDKFILITRGSFDAPPLEEGATLQTKGAGGLIDLSNKGRKMMDEITEAAKTFRETLEKLPLRGENKETMNQILDNIHAATSDLRDIFAGLRKGEGTIGALLKDPALYQDLRALMGRANRSKLLKNLIRATIVEQEKETKQPVEGK